MLFVCFWHPYVIVEYSGSVGVPITVLDSCNQNESPKVNIKYAVFHFNIERKSSLEKIGGIFHGSS